MLERSGELSRLSELIADVVASARGRIVLVRGEAGVGKSAFVRRFCAEQTVRVLWGACDALFTPRPLGPFLDIARVAGGELDQIPGSEAKPYEFATALMRTLEKTPSGVVVVEDVHWADEATLDVLKIVARRIDSLPALFVVTYRDDELDRRHPLRVLLGELSLIGRADRIDIGPLSADAVAILAGQHQVDVDVLFQKTSGNPFFVTEALASPEAEVPDTVRDAVLARAARLSPPARTVLEAVSIVPPSAEVWLLEALLGHQLDALEECLVSGMLQSVSATVSFRHELARLAIEDSLPPNEWQGLNRRALAALAEPPSGPPDLARLAHHAEVTGDVEAVLRYAPEAAERAGLVGAHREAAEHYRRALRFSDLLPPAERAELLEGRGRECYLTDQNPEAIAALQSAADCHRALGDAFAEGRALRALSSYLWCPGRVGEAQEAGRRSVALLEPLGPSRDLCLAYGNLTFLSKAAADSGGALSWGRRTLELAEALKDVELLVAGLAGRAQGAALTGDPSWHADLAHALELAQERGLIETTGWVSVEFGRTFFDCGNYPDARERLDQAFDFCSEHGLELYRQYALAYRAQAELMLGKWPEAADSAESVLRARRASTSPRIISLVVAARVRARRGDADPWPLLDEAQALADVSAELPRLGPVAVAKAEAAWLEGSLDAIASLTESALELAVRQHASWYIGELAAWRLRAGATDDIPQGAAEPYALQLAGDCARAAKLWTRMGCPYEAALALVDADEDGPLRRALAEFQTLEATPAAAIAARRLRERGVRGLPRGPRQATRQNPANLTRREVEVLGLVATGLRNSEIADRLVLSQRTIDHHVAAILRKLNVRSRSQATAEAFRLGLATAPDETVKR